MSFSEHIKNFAHKHARETAGSVTSWLGDNKSDYRRLHSNMPNASEYIRSDAGRATARHAAATGLNEFLTRSAKKSFRSGGFIKGTLFTFAHMAFQSHMDAVKNDQRIFENVAKVRRGDPEMQHMSHQHLREVVSQAQKYGGSDKGKILKAAQGELDRRMTQKNEEHAKGYQHRQSLINQHREALNDKNHVARLRRLKETAGHTAAARVSQEQKVNKILKEREANKTKQTGMRQKDIRNTVAAKERLHIIRRTAHGGIDAKGNYYSQEQIAKNAANAGKTRSAGTRKTSMKPTGTTRRKRAIAT